MLRCVTATDPNAAQPGEHLLFVCDALLSGEPDHGLLAGARPLGAARTEPGHQIVDLGQTGALVRGGHGDVAGELYAVDRVTLAAIDVRRGHPLTHQRGPIRLSDGRTAEAYFVRDDQARGRRRVRSGDWRGRFAAPRGGTDGGPIAGWARDRFRRG